MIRIGRPVAARSPDHGERLGVEYDDAVFLEAGGPDLLAVGRDGDGFARLDRGARRGRGHRDEIELGHGARLDVSGVRASTAGRERHQVSPLLRRGDTALDGAGLHVGDHDRRWPRR
jgi:hypothetical protein